MILTVFLQLTGISHISLLVQNIFLEVLFLKPKSTISKQRLSIEKL